MRPGDVLLAKHMIKLSLTTNSTPRQDSIITSQGRKRIKCQTIGRNKRTGESEADRAREQASEREKEGERMAQSQFGAGKFLPVFFCDIFKLWLSLCYDRRRAATISLTPLAALWCPLCDRSRRAASALGHNGNKSRQEADQNSNTSQLN